MKCNFWRKTDPYRKRERCRNPGSNVFVKGDLVLTVCDYNKQDMLDEHPEFSYCGRTEDWFT